MIIDNSKAVNVLYEAKLGDSNLIDYFPSL